MMQSVIKNISLHVTSLHIKYKSHIIHINNSIVAYISPIKDAYMLFNLSLCRVFLFASVCDCMNISCRVVFCTF